jgi:hypothetical protein
MAFNIFTTKWVFCFGQYDGIDDLIPCNLGRDKRPVQRQYLVNELHASAVCKCFDPLFFLHWHSLQPVINVFWQFPRVQKTSLKPFTQALRSRLNLSAGWQAFAAEKDGSATRFGFPESVPN